MKLVLAPLAEFTDAPFRRICREGGADLVYTEMVSAAALAHGSEPTRAMLETMPGEGPVACQIFGADEADVAHAAREVEAVKERFVELNLNAGCPMPRIMETGAGAALMREPAKIARLLAAMKENTSLPVTLKTRLGMHKNEPCVRELVDAAQSAGAAGMTIHARSAGQKHGGEIDLERLADAVAYSRIPVAGNGSVATRKDVETMAATGVAAVMIGRAALPDPAVFARLKGEALPEWAGDPAALHLQYILEFGRMLAAKHPGAHVPGDDGLASVKMHLHLFRYFKGRPGAAKLRARLSEIRTLAEVRETIAAFSQSSMRTVGPSPE